MYGNILPVFEKYKFSIYISLKEAALIAKLIMKYNSTLFAINSINLHNM